MKKFFLIVVCAIVPLLSFAIAPVVSNVSFHQRTDGSRMIDIMYDLSDGEGDHCSITLELSSDDGGSFGVHPGLQNLTGDIGENIAPGIGKHIVWNAGAEAFLLDGNLYRFKVLAEDGTVSDIPENFLFVDGGTYVMGRSVGIGNQDEVPVHTVSLSPFMIGEYEISQSQWSEIMGEIPETEYEFGPNYPVFNVSWYSILVYCNLRSLAEGLEPVYRINASSDPAVWGVIPVTDNPQWNAVTCDLLANGYRLPTEAEWEFAARSRTNNPDYVYSGGNELAPLAWFVGNSDLRGVKPIGLKNPNALGLHDMSGNISEFCWDWYDSYWNITQLDPPGPQEGSQRIVRGGNWQDQAYGCRVVKRSAFVPYAGNRFIGFRLCRSKSNMARVGGGTFNNGVANVTLSGFLLSKYEVTQSSYTSIMGINPSHTYGTGAAYPVYFVSWFNAIEYCNRLSLLHGLTPCYTYGAWETNPDNWSPGWDEEDVNHTGIHCNWNANGYRLPTEMEWMFAARGGTLSHDYIYSGSDTYNEVAWCYYNSDGLAHLVATKAPNELGLYDMSGNEFEWLWDIYQEYPTTPQTNPHGAANGSSRILRGGAWTSYNIYCTVAHRNWDMPTDKDRKIGFRIARNAP